MRGVKRIVVIASLLFAALQCVASQPGGSFYGLVQRITNEVPSRRSAVVDSFMLAQRSDGFPVTTDSMAYFIYRGKVDSSIAVTGDHTQWSGLGEPMTRVGGTDLYFLARKFEPDARVDYKFIIDGSWILDPLNAHTVNGGFGQNSELAMPRYVQPSSIRYNPSIPHGTLSSFVFTSTNTGDSRTMTVYLPPGTTRHRSDILHSTSTTAPTIFRSHRWQM